MLIWLLNFLPAYFIHVLILVSIIGYIYSSAISLLVPAVSLYLKPLCAALLIFGLFAEGVSYGLSELKHETEKYNLKVKELQIKSEKKTIEVITKYVDKVRIVRQKGEDRVVYVDKVITQKDNSDCKLPDAFFMLHNSAATDSYANSTGTVNEKTTGDVTSNTK